VYVQSGIYDKFVEEYANAFRAKHDLIGDPDETGKEIGPVVDKSQFDRIMAIISNAKEANEGHLLMGGQRIGTKVRSPFSVTRPLGASY
jgi:acyl-CoA reductase-like NAD-dependent aldehyde dehydrogenase